MTPGRQAAGELRASDAGRTVLLKGWVGRRRDLGELIFLSIRDRSGLVQVVFDRARCPAEAVDGAAGARSEDVVAIEGDVVLRGEGQRNRELPTGEIEVVARSLAFLARSETPPFVVEDRTNATEELRLEYRYLDLRRPAMLKNFVLRDEIAFRVRKVLHDRGFLEVETPMLTRSTPEGARDFLVPSRVHRGPVVRAAAVAPALQADPDDVRLREVLPDRSLLPRRGPAGRPPVRVHADRPRDVVPDGRGRLRHGRGLPRGGLRGGRDRRARGRSGA